MSHVQHKKHSNIVQNVAGKEDMANLKSAMTKRHVQQQGVTTTRNTSYIPY